MAKKLSSFFLVLILIITTFTGVFLNVSEAKTCKEAFDECMMVYGWSWQGILYCNIGGAWCTLYYKE